MELDKLSKHEIKELNVRNWMTHDGLWFAHCLAEVGIEKANQLNKAAMRALAPIEVKRFMKAFGLSPVRDMESFQAAFRAGWSVLSGDFMAFDFEFGADKTLNVTARRCFAYEGMKQMGVADRYECGIFHRVEGWFDALGVRYSVQPEVTGCMYVTEGRCHRTYRFEFQPEAAG